MFNFLQFTLNEEIKARTVFPTLSLSTSIFKLFQLLLKQMLIRQQCRLSLQHHVSALQQHKCSDALLLTAMTIGLKSSFFFWLQRNRHNAGLFCGFIFSFCKFNLNFTYFTLQMHLKTF